MGSEAQKSLAPGMFVALSMTENSAPLRCYVGKVQSVDQRGVRLTLIDWLTGTATGWDFFAAWSSITSALVATKEHDIGSFGESGANWQRRMEAKMETGVVSIERNIRRLKLGAVLIGSKLERYGGLQAFFDSDPSDLSPEERVLFDAMRKAHTEGKTINCATLFETDTDECFEAMKAAGGAKHMCRLMTAYVNSLISEAKR